MKDTYCSHCGALHQDDDAYPRKCRECFEYVYQNPTPVVVVLLPIGEGLLTVRRAIPPQVGQLCLPGGFQDIETWRNGCARELKEEAGIVVDPNAIQLFREPCSTAYCDIQLIFGLAPGFASEEELRAQATPHDDEVSELVVIYEDFGELAFPTHTEMARAYFEGRLQKT